MTETYEKFLNLIQTPLENLPNAKFRKGHIYVAADKLNKNPDAYLPCVMASYIEDPIIENTRSKGKHRLAKSTVDIKFPRRIAIHGIVSSFEKLDDDYLEKIEDLRVEVMDALNYSDLKFIKVGYILDTDKQSLGLAGFELIVELQVNEKYETSNPN